MRKKHVWVEKDKRDHRTMVQTKKYNVYIKYLSCKLHLMMTYTKNGSIFAIQVSNCINIQC